MPVREITMDIQGLGMILYSPPAVSHIPRGSDYLKEHFTEPAEVARHVLECQLTTFCTGSPGIFHLRFANGPRDEEAVENAKFKLRLGLQVQAQTICVRDLYDLMQWFPECPPKQQVAVEDGWYRLTVFSSPPQSGIIGDGQLIDVHLEPMESKPPLRWDGCPLLCD